MKKDKMEEKWIKDAFEKAMAKTETAQEIAHAVDDFLSRNANEMIRAWASHIGLEKASVFARIIVETPGMENAMDDLCNRFFIGGFLYSKMLNSEDNSDLEL